VAIMDVLATLKMVKKYYPVLKHRLFSRATEYVRAVDGVDLDIFKGETFGLVGESGCGKSTLGRLILGLERPSEGRVEYAGYSLNKLSLHEMRDLRKRIQIIFQDPYSSLNPRKTVERIISEPLRIHRIGSKSDRRERVLKLMEEVGLHAEHMRRYPHEFSGGQRQRICIARALALKPEFIVCDEPVSALDVSIQAQVINLFKDLQQKYELTYLFISHNLNLVHYVSDRVGVMYLGRLVELAPSKAIYGQPLHPYTKALLDATPIADTKLKRMPNLLAGDVPSPINPPPGCHFHPRCSRASARCLNEVPAWQKASEAHWVRCFL
jgi:oligopeptide/dipeptide ABC transporter ATP-binding protein